MAMSFNPPPGWPPPPPGFSPGPRWQPDPSWPPAPPGWQFWVPDEPADRMPDDQEYYAGRGLPPRHAAPTMAASADEYSPAPISSWAQQLQGPPPGTSGLAIASFVLGLLGIVGISAILGIGLGIAALRRMRDTLQRGRGLAIAGIVLGSAWLALSAVVILSVVLSTSTPAQPSTSASLGASGQRVDPFALVAGDCFDNPPVTPGHVTNVGSVVQTSCTKPHNAQVFATFAVSGSMLDYPGSAKLTSIATSGCNSRAKATLNSAMITNSMTIRLLFPLQTSWLAGHRSVSCILYSPTSELRSSVLRH